MAASSSTVVLVVVLVGAALAAGTADAAIFTITNRCSYTVWLAATPVGGGTQLNPGQTWTINIPAGTSSGRVWGRTGCSFNSAGRGSCQTGDCAGVLSCKLSGKPPLTLAEFTLDRRRRKPRLLRPVGDRRVQRGHELLLQHRR
ncbi:hypothetical protein GUJ93_ZPchr0009g1761 [Zizania palustris]|uniref:Thaumatin-like protein n=1 Tax=Zizania palustris TaxID=103762 RepID=A0A8J5RHN5_ZIZPA|nr:hypothetical protein GUJ93_ZPchr0009g1761 [Zizania palustris]